MSTHRLHKGRARVIDPESSDEIQEFSDSDNPPPVLKDRHRNTSKPSNEVQLRGASGTRTNTSQPAVAKSLRVPLKSTTSHNRQDSSGKSDAALHAAQLRLEALEAELKQKDSELAKLKKDKNKHGESHGKRHVKALKEDANQEEKKKLVTIEQSAKHYTGFVSLWIEPPTIITLLQHESDRGPDDTDTTLHNNLLENNPTARDLYNSYISHFPSEFRAEAFSKDSTSTWLTAQGNIRSTWVNRLRDYCCYDVFGTELGKEIKENRATSELLRQFLGGRSEGNHVVYPQNGPFLFPDPPTRECLEDNDWRAINIFRNPLLMRAGKCLIFGSKSIVPGGRVSSKVYGSMWGVTGVNSSFIAGVSTMVAYAASPDDEFNTVGSPTTISYFRRFLKYRKLADDILDLPEGQETYDLWDTYIFGGVQSYSSGSREESDDCDDLLSHIKARARLLKETAADVDLRVETDHHEDDQEDAQKDVESSRARDAADVIDDDDDINGNRLATPIEEEDLHHIENEAAVEAQHGIEDVETHPSGGGRSSLTANNSAVRAEEAHLKSRKDQVTTASPPPTSFPTTPTTAQQSHRVSHKPLCRSDNELLLPDPTGSPSLPAFIGTPEEYAALANRRAGESRKRSASQLEVEIDDESADPSAALKRVRRSSKLQPGNQGNPSALSGSDAKERRRSNRATSTSNSEHQSASVSKQPLGRLRRKRN